MGAKKQQTREKILEAARTEFALHGFRSASTNAICERAGVSKGTVFQHFPAKADLMWAVFEIEKEKMLSSFLVQDWSSFSDPMDRIWAVILWKIEFANAHPEETKVMTEVITSPPAVLIPRLKGQIEDLTKLSIERFFMNLPMERIRPELTEADVIRNLKIAMAGLYATYVTDHPGFVFSEQTRNECFEYMRCVFRGMEKQR